MRSVLLAIGLIGVAGCVRHAEGVVRERAASDFACADYALDVEEVAPDVYRASGCGQELIYACRPAHGPGARGPTNEGGEDDFADTASEPSFVCARRPR